MKKYIVIFLLVFVLNSCFGNSQTEEGKTEEDIKKELLGDNLVKDDTEINNENIFNTDDESNSGEIENTESGTLEEDIPKDSIEQRYLTEEEYIKLDDLDIDDFKSLEKEVTGKTLTYVDKINVIFSNPDSKFPDTTYTLQQFKAGDPTFLYRTFKKYESLDYGENTYIIEAYSGDSVSKIELKINLLEDKLEPITIDNLPEDTLFGEIIKGENGEVTYSKIDGLTLTNVGDIDLSMDSDSVTSYLSDTVGGWYYWNTLRYIEGKYGISFYVVTKDPKTNVYSYYKYYYNGDGILGILKLEDGTIETGETLKELNSRLSDKNDDFTIASLVNALFKKLID